jgi:hypothetical protein
MGLLQTKSKVFYGKNKGEIEQMCKGKDINDILSAKNQKDAQKNIDDNYIQELKDYLIKGDKHDKYEKIEEICNLQLKAEVRKAITDFIIDNFEPRKFGLGDDLCIQKEFKNKITGFTERITPVKNYLNNKQQQQQQDQQPQQQQQQQLLQQIKNQPQASASHTDKFAPNSVNVFFKHKKLTKRLLKKH